MEYQCDKIMERIRGRQSELAEDRKENEIVHTQESIIEKLEVKSSPTKIFGSSLKANVSDEPKTPLFKSAEPNEVSPSKTEYETVEQTSARKARFSALAQDYVEFECDFQNSYNKPKEAYMKGRSPRMSIGETRPSVLCTPAGAASLKSPNIANSQVTKISDFEERRIKFAQPMVNVNFIPNESSVFSGSSVNDSVSTMLGGSSDMMNLTTSSLSGDFSINQQITAENTILNAQSCDNREAIIRDRNEVINVSSGEYGAHTFMRKKVVSEEIPLKSKSIHTMVSSPKPFSKDVGASRFSPVNFTPRSTSSPKFSQSEIVFSPSKSAAIESNKAKIIKNQFEQKLSANTNIPVPTPRNVVNANPTTPLGHAAPQQHALFSNEHSKVAPVPGGVQTQWRGKQNIPVVQGARAEEKTAGNAIVGAGASKLQNLKSRWEFSSATGTPIHPDATEDSLVATAIRMKETAIPNKVHTRSLTGRSATSSSSIPARASHSVRSATTSPAAKSVRYEETDLLDDDVFEETAPQNPEQNEEANPVASDDHFDEESGDELASTDASRIIDQAFDFMDRGSKMGTPSPYRPSLDGQAPLAQLEAMSSPRKRITEKMMESDIIEEEDVQMGEDDEEEEEEEENTVQAHGDTIREEEESRIEKEWSERKNDSRLPYSVSFYRKIRREKVADQGVSATPIEPTAPPTNSLTSAHVLKKLTDGDRGSGSPGKVVENEKQLKERMKRAIKVEDEHISQSKRALALCRETPTFRGSREEIEMQRALLIAVERQRALLAEYERIQRDGPTIVEGPRGEITVSQLQVNLSKEYVQSNIASSKKSPEVYYFVAILKWGEQVEVSKLVTSDAAINRKGVLDFAVPLQLKEIPPDFRATIEIYGQKSHREFFSHEDKYKLKGSTLKSKNADDWCYYVDKNEQEKKLVAKKDSFAYKMWKKLNSKNTLGNSSVIAPPMSMSSVDSNYNLLGSFSFDINCPGKKIYNMSHPVYPLEGVAMMKVKKRAVDGSDIVYSGFLSMYQRTREGLGCWTRYWCVLDSGEMKFWRHPEDEGAKNWLVLLDLSTCIRSDGASIVADMCPYPNSFHIDVWVPREEGSSRSRNTNSDIEQLRVMLAADTPSDLSKWLSVINGSSRQLCTWRHPIP